MNVEDLFPVGHRVLIKPDPIEEVSEGGILINTQDKSRKEQAQSIGTLIKIGSSCWKDFHSGEPWAKVGDKVVFSKFGGYEISINGELHRVMNDEDVTAIVNT